MKKTLFTIAASIVVAMSAAFAHTGVELGPNGGRLLEFSKDESMHGEVTVKDGKFQILLLDKAMKPVALADQTLTATGGDRQKPEKLAVEKAGDRFVVPVVKEGQWVIFQFRENAKAKPVTARLEYDTNECGECKNPEWLCKCGAEEHGKKK